VPDDRDPPKRRGHQGDTQRANACKRYRAGTPLRGVPADFADEPTPPPVPVEFDETMPLDEQVIALRGALGDHTRAITRLWDGRDGGSRLDRLDAKLDGMVSDVAEITASVKEFLVPNAKAVMARLEATEQRSSVLQPKLSAFYEHEWPSAQRTILGLDDRLRRLELGQERTEREMNILDEQTTSAAGGLSKRIDAVESRNETRDIKIRTLEDWKLSIKAQVAIAATLISAGVALGAWLLERLT